MPRIARLVGTGYPHHVIQRGNNKEKVFLDKEDFQKYISLLERYSSEKEASILAYGLMTNHVHLLVKPLRDRKGDGFIFMPLRACCTNLNFALRQAQGERGIY